MILYTIKLLIILLETFNLWETLRSFSSTSKSKNLKPRIKTCFHIVHKTILIAKIRASKEDVMLTNIFQHTKLYSVMVPLTSALPMTLSYAIIIFCGYKTYVRVKQSANSPKTKQLQQRLTTMMILQVSIQRFLYIKNHNEVYMISRCLRENGRDT